MFYSRQASRQAFKADVQRLFEEALHGPPGQAKTGRFRGPEGTSACKSSIRIGLMALGMAACTSTWERTAGCGLAAAPPPMAARARLRRPRARAPTDAAPERRRTATTIEPGIAECDLVRLKGKPATDVLVGESGKGQREVQVLYSEPGGRELYFFVNNRLDRIVKP